MSGTVITLVGHCGPDMFMLRNAIRNAAPDATIEVVDSDAAVASIDADVLLVNRVLDGSFADTRGIDLIARLSASRTGPRPAILLISNYADAQSEAEAAGALPGFGKSDLYSDQTRERLLAAIEHARAGATN
ncbi:MAG: hypothetical protein ACF8SC_05000 [Phycisphaerales bacterium JB037]